MEYSKNISIRMHTKQYRQFYQVGIFTPIHSLFHSFIHLFDSHMYNLQIHVNMRVHVRTNKNFSITQIEWCCDYISVEFHTIR